MFSTHQLQQRVLKYLNKHLSVAIWLLIAIALSSVIMGCSIGVKENIKIIYVSYAPIPEVSAIRIATNEKIPVTIDNNITNMDVGGYYIVSSRDLKAFIEAINEIQDTR